jgi:hypothetical protein
MRAQMTPPVQYITPRCICAAQAPRFKDPPHAYTHSRYDPAQCIVIDVRQLPASADLDGSSKHGGEGKLAWGLLPVFQDNGMLKVGAHQVPLFTGAFPTELLGEVSDRMP